MQCCFAPAHCLSGSARRRSIHCGGQLAEFGVIAAQGVAGLAVMRLELAEVEGSLPEQVVSMAELLFEQVAALSEQIAGLEKEIRSRTRAREDMKRLMTIPGIGPDLCDGAA